jgi:cytochrome c oxidase subunit 4
MSGNHIVSTRVYLGVFLALLVLTGGTVWAARHDFGALNTPVALGIAIVKAVLVILFFMHVKYSPRLTKLVVGSAFVWLAIMILGTLSDFYSPNVNSRQHLPTISRE